MLKARRGGGCAFFGAFLFVLRGGGCAFFGAFLFVLCAGCLFLLPAGGESAKSAPCPLVFPFFALLL